MRGGGGESSPTQRSKQDSLLRDTFAGIYPGSQTKTLHKNPIDSSLAYSKAMLGIPSLKRDSDKDFKQSLEKIIFPLQNKRFRILLVAESYHRATIQEIIGNLFELGSEVHSLVKQSKNKQGSHADTQGSGSSKTKGKTLGQSQTDTYNESETYTKGTSQTNTETKSDRTLASKSNALGALGVGVMGGLILGGAGGMLVGAAQGVAQGASVGSAIGSVPIVSSGTALVGAGVGGVAGSQIGGFVGSLGGAVAGVGVASTIANILFNASESKSKSHTISESRSTTKGKSHSRTNSLSLNHSNTTSINKSQTKTITLSLTYEELDKNAEFCEKLIEAYIERFQKGLNHGLWKTSLYIQSDDLPTLSQVEHTLKSVYSGDKSYFEPIRFSNVIETDTLIESNQCELHTLPMLYADGYENPIHTSFSGFSTAMNTEELSLLAAMPTKDIQGLQVSQSSHFALTQSPIDPNDEYIHIGNVLHRGEKTPQRFKISLNALNHHLFVSGITGGGKSNSIKQILCRLQNAPTSSLQGRGQNYNSSLGDRRQAYNSSLQGMGQTPTSSLRGMERQRNDEAIHKHDNTTNIYHSQSIANTCHSNNTANTCHSDNTTNTCHSERSEESLRYKRDISAAPQYDKELVLSQYDKELATPQYDRQGYNETENTLNFKIPFLVIEPAKSEYKHLKTKIKDLQIFSPGSSNDILRLNPFVFERQCELTSHVDMLKATFVAAFPMEGPMPYILESALHRIYTDKGWDFVSESHPLFTHSKHADYDKKSLLFPTMNDLYSVIDSVVAESGYANELDSNLKAALKTRIKNLTLGVKGKIYNTRHCFRSDLLFTKPTIIELSHIADDCEKSFLMGILLNRLYQYRQGQGDSNNTLQHICVIEEAHRLLPNIALEKSSSEANAKGAAVQVFVNMLAEIRSYGEGLIIADQIASKLHRDVIKNTGTKIIHRTMDKEDRDILGHSINLKDEQILDIATLKSGQAIVHNGEVHEAFMVGIDKVECNIVSGEIVEDFYSKFLEEHDEYQYEYLFDAKYKLSYSHELVRYIKGINLAKRKRLLLGVFNDILLDRQTAKIQDSIQKLCELFDEFQYASKLAEREGELITIKAKTKFKATCYLFTETFQYLNILGNPASYKSMDNYKDIIGVFCDLFLAFRDGNTKHIEIYLNDIKREYFTHDKITKRFPSMNGYNKKDIDYTLLLGEYLALDDNQDKCNAIMEDLELETLDRLDKALQHLGFTSSQNLEHCLFAIYRKEHESDFLNLL